MHDKCVPGLPARHWRIRVASCDLSSARCCVWQLCSQVGPSTRPMGGLTSRQGRKHAAASQPHPLLLRNPITPVPSCQQARLVRRARVCVLAPNKSVLPWPYAQQRTNPGPAPAPVVRGSLCSIHEYSTTDQSIEQAVSRKPSDSPTSGAQ